MDASELTFIKQYTGIIESITNSYVSINSISSTVAPTNGRDGARGPTGPSISYIEGNQPYAPPGSLLTTNIGTSQTAVYQVGPVTSLATTKFLIIANTSLTTNAYGLQLTVGRSATNNDIAANSINIVSNTSPLVLPAATTAYYMAAYAQMNQSTGPINLTGTAIDAPGAGSFYYTIWMQSSTSHTYSNMTAFLTVLKIQQ